MNKKIVFLLIFLSLMVLMSQGVFAKNYDIIYKKGISSGEHKKQFNAHINFLNYLDSQNIKIKKIKTSEQAIIALTTNNEIYMSNMNGKSISQFFGWAKLVTVEYEVINNKIIKVNGQFKDFYASRGSDFIFLNEDDTFSVMMSTFVKKYYSSYWNEWVSTDLKRVDHFKNSINNLKIKDLIIIGSGARVTVIAITKAGGVEVWGNPGGTNVASGLLFKNKPSGSNWEKLYHKENEWADPQVGVKNDKGEFYLWHEHNDSSKNAWGRPSQYFKADHIIFDGPNLLYDKTFSMAIENGDVKYYWGYGTWPHGSFRVYNLKKHKAFRNFMNNNYVKSIHMFDEIYTYDENEIFYIINQKNQKEFYRIVPKGSYFYSLKASSYPHRRIYDKMRYPEKINVNTSKYEHFIGGSGLLIGIKPSTPQVQTSSITFNEGEQSSHLIKAGGGEGELTYSTSGVPSGMTFKKVSNGYEVKWKPEYNINKNKFSSKVTRNFDLTITDSKGEGETKNITVYVNNQPKPIDNIDNYKTISDLPVKPVDTELEKPELPVFDKDSNLADKNMFTDITNYTFVEVEEKAPYPGDEPNMIAKIKTSLVEGSNQDIHNSLSNGNVEGYKDFTNELVKYNQARDAYKNLEDLVEKQYDEQDNDELFFNNLKELIKYNNENNYLGEEIDLADYKDYDNMKALYDLLKNKLQTRQGKLDENIKQYNKYVKAVEEYNSLLENRLGLLIDNYKTDYIPKYESWKTDKENYLNNLQSKVQEYNSYNENLYNQKVEEIASSIDQYGLVSLKVNDVNQPPNLDAHYLSEVNKFDLNAIDNIYGSIKDYPYLDTEIKNSIKNKFNDGVYNEEKFDWLENTVKTNLDVSIRNSTDVNEKYLIE